MSYVLIEANPNVHAHWGLFCGQISKHHHHWHHKLENAHIEKVWAQHAGPGHVFYQFHIKSGHFPKHHHFTVLAEHSDFHGNRILNIQEGHDTIF